MGAGKESRGSEWRKWDLHLHCPGTKLADAFGGSDAAHWDRYCAFLHNSDVHAFGITDYFSVDGYEKCIQEYRARFPDCHKQFFLNVELRTPDVVNKAKEEVNIHLVFNPTIPAFLDKAKQLLAHVAGRRRSRGESAKALRTLQPRQVFVEGAQRKMACLASNLKRQAVGESQCRALSELLEGRGDHFRILQREILVIQQPIQG